MTIAETASTEAEPIRPVRWWTGRPAFDALEGPELRRIREGIRARGPFHVAELEAIAAGSGESSEARYVAMGYLVAIHNAGHLDSDEVIAFFDRVARSALAPSQWFCRRNALEALAHLRDGATVHPRALARLIALARDPSFQAGERDALAALAATGDRRALAPLAAWVIELAETGAGDRLDPTDEAIEPWPARWRDRAQLFVRWLAGSGLRCHDIDPAAIMAPLWSPGAAPGCVQEVQDFLLEAALHLAHDARMTGILAALVVACERGDADRADRRRRDYLRVRRLPAAALDALRMRIGGRPAAPAAAIADRI